jgi:hypothetical protein
MCAKKTDFHDNEEIIVVSFAKLNGGWKDDALVLDKPRTTLTTTSTGQWKMSH